MGRRCLGTIGSLVLSLASFAGSTSIRADSPVQYQFQILHQFGGQADGAAPWGEMVFDKSGDLYGVTEVGGADDIGTVFELTPAANGQWTEQVLHSFSGGPADGVFPTGVVIDGGGNLYGTTVQGGINEDGTVFELSPGTDGQWTESIIWNFCSLPGCADGDVPRFPPTLGPGGVLYGTSGDTAFELMLTSDGWTLTPLYTFCSLPNCTDGEGPVGSPVLDAKGNLYGETGNGGIAPQCDYPGCGVVYVLHPQPTVPWNEMVLLDFGGNKKGTGPAGVTLHGRALYGTTQGGGEFGCHSFGCGTVFDLTRDGAVSIGAYEQLLHQFGANEARGINPIAAVEFDQRGNLFGVTNQGGSPSCNCGTVYGMKPQSNGKWAFAVLHAFEGTDGSIPTSALTLDSKGNIYGTTQAGGPYGGGVVFELSPTAQSSK